MFVGREKEINEIREALETPQFESVILIGRRRVGKTEIIREALRVAEQPVLNIECKKVTVQENLRDISNEVCAFFSLPEHTAFKTFEAVFDFVMSESVRRKFILVIDEFSYLLDEKNHDIESSLAKSINKYKPMSQLKLVLAGSYVHLMERIIESTQPLYGRFTHIIAVYPFDYYDSSFFYPEYTNEDKIRMYSCFGGMPYFNSLVNPRKSFYENVIELIVRKDSILEHEINEIVLGETLKIDSMNSVIGLVSRGCCKYSDIHSSLSSEKSVRPDYILQKLCNMKILAKSTPVNEPDNKKRTFYHFCDNLLHFYYRFVFSNYSKRNFMDVGDFYRIFINKAFNEEYIPHKFEEISREFLIRKNINHQISPVFFNIGTFSGNGKKGYRQFDVVTEDELGYVSYECKFTEKPVDMSVVNEEKLQTADSTISGCRFGFISRSGFADQVLRQQDLQLWTLKDFY